MDFDKKKRRQSLKVIISEAIMVLTVAITVILLAFAVSGYWLNADFEVKRQGMLQISSIPTGADVDIDGESSWLQRTNTSKVLATGEHTITLTKENYDTWSKTINIKEGLLYRIHYPRLFLKERFAEKLLLVAETTFATVSSDRTTLLLINDTTEWTYINLKDEQLAPKKIDITPYFSNTELAPLNILAVNWDADSTKALFKVEVANRIEWVLLNLKDPKNSINLSREFNADFSNIKIFNNDASSLLALQDGNLRKIDVSGRSISVVLAEGVTDFDFYHNEIIFSAQNHASVKNPYYIGILKLNDKTSQLISLDSPAKVGLTKFYEEKYIVSLVENSLTLYQKDDLSSLVSFELSFPPEVLKIGHEGEFILAYSGSNIATLDMETMSVEEWSVAGESFDWLDSDMVYAVADGQLSVYDFDGLNPRNLAQNVSADFPVAITENRYLYYFSDNYLMREWLIPR